VVEHRLAKARVAGSSPVSRSSSCPGPNFRGGSRQRARQSILPRPALQLQSDEMARYPSGKGEVCKTFMRRFDSDPRLQIPSTINSRGGSDRLSLTPCRFQIGATIDDQSILLTESKYGRGASRSKWGFDFNWQDSRLIPKQCRDHPVQYASCQAPSRCH
jgi:hypothetical protein